MEKHIALRVERLRYLLSLLICISFAKIVVCRQGRERERRKKYDDEAE